MKKLLAAVLALALVELAHARPLVLEESAKLTPPDPSWQYFGRAGVAIDGDEALVLGERQLQLGETEPHAAALIYRRSGANWDYVGTLGAPRPLAPGIQPGLAMKGGVAMVVTDRARVFERAGAGWVESPVVIDPVTVDGSDIDIDVDASATRILVPTVSCTQDKVVLRKVGTEWRIDSVLAGAWRTCASPPYHRHDIYQGRIAAHMQNDGEPPHLRIYYGSWGADSPVPLSPAAAISPDVALLGYFTFSTDSRRFGTRVMYADTFGMPQRISPYGLQAADAHLQVEASSATALERVGNYLGQRNWSHDHRAHVINLFMINSDNAFTGEHVGMLRARFGLDLGSRFDWGGGRVIVNGYAPQQNENAVRIFDVPEELTPYYTQYHDFEDFGARAWWQPAAGSLFFEASSGGGKVYRQPSTNGTPSSWLPYSSLPDQAIQAQITLRTFSGTDRWVGLGTRRTDDNNYYYAALRTSGVVELNRVLNGVTTTLHSAPARISIGQMVRLRLESIGTLHRIYVNDRLVSQVTDHNLSGGLAGIIMHRAAADYDNVTIGRAPFTTIYADDFIRSGPHEWRYEGNGWQRFRVMSQSNSDGYARLHVGARTADQTVQVRVRPLTFANPDNWVGLMLRYKDARNHAYLSLRGRGVISLWRRENGAITQLATRSIPVTPGNWYTLRAEVVLGTARVFVNDVLQFKSGGMLGPNDFDTAEMKGSVGLITYKATAEFDDFLAYQP